MSLCTVYLLYGGLTFATLECHPQMFHGDGVITPHEVVYTSHIEPCKLGYGNFIARHRVNLHTKKTRVRRYHNIRRRYRSRVRYTSRHNRPRLHRLHRRTVTRHYNRHGKLRKRVVTRRLRW